MATNLLFYKLKLANFIRIRNEIENESIDPFRKRNINLIYSFHKLKSSLGKSLQLTTGLLDEEKLNQIRN